MKSPFSAHSAAYQFMVCMRSVLQNSTPCFATDEQIHWKALIQLAKEQAVTGLLYDAVSSLSAGQRPPRQVLISLYTDVVYIEQQNKLLDQTIGQLLDAYRSCGITDALLIKGQGIARCYTHPHRRTPGDIDVFLPTNFEPAYQWSLQNGTDVQPFTPRTKHIAFTWKNVSIENHFKLAQYYDKRLNSRLQQIITEGLTLEPSLSVRIHNQTVQTLPPTLGLLHLIVHYSIHLVSWGVGMRQCMDILLYMRENKQRVNKEQLDVWIKELELEHITTAIAGIGTDWFDFSDTDILYNWSPNPPLTTRLLNIMFHRGNFGMNLKPKRHGASGSFWNRSVLFVRQSRETYRFMPREVRAALRGKALSSVHKLCAAIRRNKSNHPHG